MITSANLFFALGLMFAAGLLILAVVSITSFVKISVVLFLLRTALGIQQSPPNIVLYAIALILAAFVAAPLGREVYQGVAGGGEVAELDPHTLEDWQAIARRAEAPVQAHLLRFTQPRERAFFLEAAQKLWPPEMHDATTADSLPVLVPSYLIGELRRAFEIGFLIYLPFVTIDLVITTILIAMGMSQVQPSTIAVPLKLLLFVLASGWTRLLHGLVLSYIT